MCATELISRWSTEAWSEAKKEGNQPEGTLTGLQALCVWDIWYPSRDLCSWSSVVGKKIPNEIGHRLPIHLKVEPHVVTVLDNKQLNLCT